VRYRDLKAKLADLAVELAAIRAEGKILVDARIDSSIPGGSTVRGQPSTQYRLRVKGQKSRYLKAAEVPEFRAAIARGKRLRKLECEQHRTQEQLQRLVTHANNMGLELPE
jgi:hypothetical protein